MSDATATGANATPLTTVTWRETDEIDAALSSLRVVELGTLEPAPQLGTLPHFSDDRGTLVPVDVPSEIPFPVLRAWTITAAPADQIRARHAHFVCEQAFWSTQGAARFVLTDGVRVTEVTLAGPADLLYVPAGLWVQIDRCEAGTVLVAFASLPYDVNDYRSSIGKD